MDGIIKQEEKMNEEMAQSLDQTKDEEEVDLSKRGPSAVRPVLVILGVLMVGIFGLFTYLQQEGSGKAPSIIESPPPSPIKDAPASPEQPPKLPEITPDKVKTVRDRATLDGPIKELSESGEVQGRDKVVEIQRGDTLSELAMRIYGRYFSGNIHNKIRRANPQISNLNDIVPGQKIVFPDVPLSSGTKDRSYYSVNVGSFHSRERTQNSVELLLKKGYRAFLAPVRLADGQEEFWVLAGHFTIKKSAEKAAAALKQQTFDDAKVMYVDPKKALVVIGEKDKK